MRVLFLVHDFLPAHPSGTEVYTGAVALRLAERGHELAIFATEKDIGRAHLTLTRRSWNGLAVHELVNNLFYADFRETWDFPPAAQAFEGVLEEFQPDVVHVMHLLYLSLGCVEAAHRRGIPVFFTLHDFWLQCPRFGQRLHPDGGLCATIDHQRCGTCLSTFKFAQSPLERRAARVLGSVRRWTGVDATRAARTLGDRLRRRKAVPRPAPEAAERFAALAKEREAVMRARLVPCVERFIAPSAFLRERFLEWGLPRERVVTLGYGIELDPWRDFTRHPAAKVRLSFLGTLAPHKAPHLVLTAFARLAPELRARAQLTIHGPRHHFPEYVTELERAARAVGATLTGMVARERIVEVLAETDLLIVPSVWYENSPLTIHEALATRTPVLVSDLGGMAELVEPGRDGWRFRAGDVADLAAHLERLLRDPAALMRLPFGAPPKDMRTSARELEELYLAAGTRSTAR